jgi:FlaA1/EpsC-like NDP-sugar epimerase
MNCNSNLKTLYLTLAATAAAGYFYVPNATWPGISLMIAACLLVSFFGKERIEDERVEHLKMKAIKSAFAGAFILVFLYTWLIASLRQEGWKEHLLSAYDLIIVTMLIALVLYHYWRWQDGRGKPINH